MAAILMVDDEQSILELVKNGLQKTDISLPSIRLLHRCHLIN